MNNGRSTEPSARAIIPYKHIRDGICRSNKDFNLANITRDQRLLNLLPEKLGNFFPTSNFYKVFTNFQLEENDFSRINGYEPLEYKYTNREISKIFTLHIVYSDKHIYDKNVTYYKFDFLPVFIFAKTRGVGQNFNQIFHNFLHENDTQVFTTEDKFEAGNKDKILFDVKKNDSFDFCIDHIADAGNHGIYHYVSKSFYNVLLNTNPRLKEMYYTWYLISRENLTAEHPLLTYNQDIDQRGVRLFFLITFLAI